MTTEENKEIDALNGLGGALERLDRMLARAVARVVEAYGEAATDPFRGLYIREQEAVHWSINPRLTPIFGAAEGEAALLDLAGSGSSLATLAEAYGLSSFDLDLTLIALAPEVDMHYGRIYAFLQDDVSRRRPSVDLGLNLLCATPDEKLARHDHFSSASPLIRHELIQLTPDQEGGAPLLAHFMELDQSVVRHLLGLRGLEARMRRSVALHEPDGGVLSPSMSSDQRAIGSLVRRARDADQPMRLYLSGSTGRSKRETAEAAAADVGTPLVAVDLDYALASDVGPARVFTLAFHEARLRGAILYVEPLELLDTPEHATTLRRLWDALVEHPGVAILAGSQPTPQRRYGLSDLVHVPFRLPTHAERRGCWKAGLDDAGIALSDDELDQLAGRFRLTSHQIGDAIEIAANQAQLRLAAEGLPASEAGPAPQPTLDDLFLAARTRSGPDLGALARKIEPIHQWDQIVLPEDTVAQLKEICHQIVGRHRVLEEWGFARRHSLGTGVSALFSGPSGTGKTMGADIIARELGLDLYKIDLSAVVSKFIGETEKNLRRIFTAAENANAILFFDEADALFGKRSEVRDSHDRYANIEIAYLLQQMEQYEGIAILATNLRGNMDEAFVRRLQFAVEFPFPDEEQRSRIWRLQFPAEAARDEDIDFESFAKQFRLTGGNIKNIVLGAAYLAASESKPINARYLLHATRREYQKMGKVLTPPEVAPDRGGEAS